MIDYLIPIGIGVFCGVAYSIYKEYQFKKFDERCERLGEVSKELSRRQNISKLVKILKEKEKSQNP